MKSRMPERARTDPWEPQGSNPLGPPGPELLRRFSEQPMISGRSAESSLRVALDEFPVLIRDRFGEGNHTRGA